MQPATPDFTQQNSNAPITSFIHPEDQKTMISAIDTARLGGKSMSKKQRQKLEEESARIAEGYKMQMPSSFGGLANVFDQQLQQQPVTPNFALNPRNIATPEMQAQILQELASLGQNTQGMQTPFPVGQQPSTPQVAQQAEQPRSNSQENKGLSETLKKTKEYKTNEGKFSQYNFNNFNGEVTVNESKKGFTIRNIYLPDEYQRQGIGTNIYRAINKESLEKTGKPLMSTKPREIQLSNSKEKVWELSDKAKGMWQKLVDSGEAIKNQDGTYQFKTKNNKLKK
jgi:hypothetical protein